jgi:hypothetical protein
MSGRFVDALHAATTMCHPHVANIHERIFSSIPPRPATERLTRTSAFQVAFFWILANLGI